MRCPPAEPSYLEAAPMRYVSRLRHPRLDNTDVRVHNVVLAASQAPSCTTARLGTTATGTHDDSSLGAHDGSFSLLGDQPHVEGKDPLGFDDIVGDLTDLVLASRQSTPFTLGVDAGWGMGKSSLMRKMEVSLQSKRDVETVWFNAWTAEGHSVLEGLIKSVLDKIDPNILRRTLRRKHLMSGVRVVMSIVAGVLRVGNVVDKIWERISIDPRARNQMRDLMVHAMDEWIKRGRTTNGRLLVVFIDDLDRCSPTNVFQVFEAVKLYLDTQGFVFIIGFDSTVVSEAILAEKKYSKQITSRDYLDKIIQILYQVPVPDEEQVQVFIEQCLESSNTASLFDPSIRSLVTERNSRNPRKIKRFINMFVLGYGLDRDWAELGASDLVKLLIMQLYFPDFARLLQGTAQRDPIAELLSYVDCRDLLLRRVSRDGDAWANVRSFAEAHELTIEETMSHADVLQLLEQHLPETYPALAADPDFVALLRTFPEGNARARLREKLVGRYVSTLAPVETALGADLPGRTVDLTGLRVAWYLDDPEGESAVLNWLERQGATVRTWPHYDELVSDLSRGADPPHVLVLDMGRRGDDEAGLRHVRRLADSKAYRGPVVFFTSRITPSRRKAATSLQAEITNDPGELAALLAEHRPGAPAKGVATKRRSGVRARVLLGYRRTDAAGHAGRLYDRLVQALGEEQVFRDIDMIPPGADFVATIREVVEKADVYLEMIGPTWVTVTDTSGRRLLDDPDDFSRLSLATALDSGKRVIPVLVGGARMPTAEELPEDIRPLVRRNGLELSDERWEYDVSRLLDALDVGFVDAVELPSTGPR